VELERRLRDIKRFSCIEELKAQLARDVESI
jgi:FAD synthase